MKFTTTTNTTTTITKIKINKHFFLSLCVSDSRALRHRLQKIQLNVRILESRGSNIYSSTEKKRELSVNGKKEATATARTESYKN